MKFWQRTVFFIAVYFCVLILPWWLSAVLLAGFTIFVPIYAEVIFFGFVFDTMYSSGHTGLVIATVFLVAVMFVKTRIRT